MQFGLYAPIPMATVGSPETVQAINEALAPLPEGRRDAQYDHCLELLLAADKVGFDLCLFAERHLGNDVSAWLLASAIGARLDRIKPLVAVHPGLWDPVMTAKLAVSLDRMCRGRMAINIVNGWFDEEFKMFGGTVLAGQARYGRAAEFIAILRGLWTNESFSFKGEHYEIEAGRLLLKPASPVPPQIYSVSAGDQGRDFIAGNCDWWFVNFPKEAQNIDEVLRGIEAAVVDMRRRADALGRTIRYALNPFVAIGDSPQAALEDTVKRIFETEPDGDRRKIEHRMLPPTRAGLMGRSEQIQAQLRRYESMGFELILCKMIPTPDNIRKIGQEVIAPMRMGATGLAMAT